MIFEELAVFKKDCKALQKRYKSLKEDLETVKQILTVIPNERPPFSFKINNLGIETCVIKVKKIACRSLKGRGVNSGLRLVYAYFEVDEKIIFIELFHKNDKANEDRKRILDNFE